MFVFYSATVEPSSFAVLMQRILRASVRAGESRVQEVFQLNKRRPLPHICVGLLLFSLTSGGALGNTEVCMRFAPMSWLGEISCSDVYSISGPFSVTREGLSACTDDLMPTCLFALVDCKRKISDGAV